MDSYQYTSTKNGNVPNMYFYVPVLFLGWLIKKTYLRPQFHVKNYKKNAFLLLWFISVVWGQHSRAAQNGGMSVYIHAWYGVFVCLVIRGRACLLHIYTKFKCCWDEISPDRVMDWCPIKQTDLWSHPRAAP